MQTPPCGFILDGLPRLCCGWRGDRGYIQQSRRGRNRGNGWVTSGHDVQKLCKNTAPFLVEAVFCVRLTAHLIIMLLYALVEGRYRDNILLTFEMKWGILSKEIFWETSYKR